MAVGGTGDILTGIIASLLALGNNNFESACIGAYLCGKLGEEFQKLHENDQKGNVKTFKASDLVKIIPRLIAKFV
jgi:NAD(P)H-hydrate epimerase